MARWPSVCRQPANAHSSEPKSEPCKMVVLLTVASIILYKACHCSMYVRQIFRPRHCSPSVEPGMLKVITWNCGGLHATRYAELMAWLNEPSPDGPHIVLIQECHWPHSLEFNSDKWVHIYSGMGQAQGGVMIIISRKPARPDQVRFVELAPGRMVHARLALEPPIDILCVYQRAWASAADSSHEGVSRSDFQSALLEKRQQVWHRLKVGFLRCQPVTPS